MRPIIFITLVVMLAIFAWRGMLGRTNFWKARAIPQTYRAIERVQIKRSDHARDALQYAKDHRFNTGFCFLIDMSLPSGQNRFFVYNLENDSVEASSQVTHGRCNERWLKGRKYGNDIGCGCTSLGRYSVGKPYQGRFGLAYKLHGLDDSNNNAFKRFVVLHSHECVPATATYPSEICQSDGCPTVSPPFLKTLASKIDRSDKPVLLWIYE